MEQVCSITNCSAVIVIQEGQEAAMFNGKPVCEKCDRFLHKSLPISTGKLVSVKKPYEEPEAYKQESFTTDEPFMTTRRICRPLSGATRSGANKSLTGRVVCGTSTSPAAWNPRRRRNARYPTRS
ncbi:hypothetical protein F4604DRAFT_1907427 [Suillus subluteus]|nr:hypothetical protein F4604DRAFT_1907427 [Suillus subluteus]